MPPSQPGSQPTPNRMLPSPRRPRLYREALAASLAAAKSELEKTRRLAREAAEASKAEADGAMAKQVLQPLLHPAVCPDPDPTCPPEGGAVGALVCRRGFGNEPDLLGLVA